MSHRLLICASFNQERNMFKLIKIYHVDSNEVSKLLKVEMSETLQKDPNNGYPAPQEPKDLAYQEFRFHSENL